MLERRDFLRGAVYLGSAALSGCRGEGSVSDLGGASTLEQCDSESLTDEAPSLGFVGEDESPLDEPVGVGWDGRLFTDLSSLDEGGLVIDNERFYVRTFFPDQLDESTPWTVRLDGLVESPEDVPVDEIVSLAADQGEVLLECAGNYRGGSFGLLSSAGWSGVPLLELLERTTRMPDASRILVSGFDGHSIPSAGMHSTPGASWIFTPLDLERTGAFLATHMNGVRLPRAHGFPLRLVVPGWYGCVCVKWVDQVSWVAEDAPATSQMQEFWSRTHQSAQHALARDYLPAEIDQAAMPVRVERWLVGGELVHRIVGILWGGRSRVTGLSVSVDAGASFERVELCFPVRDNRTWSLWDHVWRPPRVGTYPIVCRIDEPVVSTRRLDRGYYLREVEIPET